jgi:hypothetical protein
MGVNMSPSNNNEIMDIWAWATILYVIIAVLSFLPVIQAILRKVKLYPDGHGYESCDFFSEPQKKRLIDHYSRIQGTLFYWKNRAQKYSRYHKYCLFWTTIIAILIPILSQSIGAGQSNLFLTIMSTHAALLLGFHKALKVEKNFQSFRLAESEFYDLRRELLDTPEHFGKDEKEQVDTFFEKIRMLRISARKEEVDNTPSLKTDK